LKIWGAGCDSVVELVALSTRPGPELKDGSLFFPKLG
jgi:hypothetical protein